VVSVPLARRNLLANTPRLIRSVSGIAFAVLLMIVELGFRDGFLESMVMNLRALDGDIMLISSAKYQVDRISPFSRRQLYEARAVPGVASASPLYIERLRPIWTSGSTGSQPTASIRTTRCFCSRTSPPSMKRFGSPIR